MTSAGTRPLLQESAVPDATVSRFRQRDDADELARINRLTGLSFESLPASLLATATSPAGHAATDAPARAEPSARPARS